MHDLKNELYKLVAGLAERTDTMSEWTYGQYTKVRPLLEERRDLPGAAELIAIYDGAKDSAAINRTAAHDAANEALGAAMMEHRREHAE